MSISGFMPSISDPQGVDGSSVGAAGWTQAVTSLPYIQLSQFGRCKEKLVPGQLRGNRFQLRVRGVRGSAAEALQGRNLSGALIGIEAFIRVSLGAATV